MWLSLSGSSECCLCTGRELASAPVPGGVSHHDPAYAAALVSRESALPVDREGKRSRHHRRLETTITVYSLPQFTPIFTSRASWCRSFGQSMTWFFLSQWALSRESVFSAPQPWSGTAPKKTSRRRLRRCRRNSGPCPPSRLSLFAAFWPTAVFAGSSSPLRWSTSACSSLASTPWVLKSIFFCPLVSSSRCVDMHWLCSYNEYESPYSYISPLFSIHLYPPHWSIHHCRSCSPWVAKQGAAGPCLIISWSSPLVLPNMRRSTYLHTELNTSPCSMWMEAPCALIHMLISFPSWGSSLNDTVPTVSHGITLVSKVYCFSKINVIKHACFFQSSAFLSLFIQPHIQLWDRTMLPNDVTKMFFHSICDIDVVQLLLGSKSKRCKFKSTFFLHLNLIVFSVFSLFPSSHFLSWSVFVFMMNTFPAETNVRRY